MYKITCDGLPLLDWRDNSMIVLNPKVNLEVNTVGEGSFTIYKNHPHFDSLKKLKSIFEVTDDLGVIFRGRATSDTVAFDSGLFVDLEGAMAYFNDSVVRPFNFPDDYLEDADYIAAAQNGDAVRFFLKLLIDNHNSQVQDFQKMKLGNVTVKDPNFARAVSELGSTWGVLKGKLFESSLGGYLCIRYEEDGNYIDYLSEFTETNSQEVEFGENLLDLKSETEASGICSAIIPIGAAGLTIEGLDDGDITDDIVKTGDTLYSKAAVAEFGWIYAPTSETTWDEVVDGVDLLTTGVEWLVNGGLFLKSIEATAVDLHFTDKQAESLRIYKNVKVKSSPHNVEEIFPLGKLEIDILNPQNTKITVGKTVNTLTEKTALQQEEAREKYAKLAVTLEGFTVTDETGTTKISGSSIDTETLSVSAANITDTLTADQIKLGGNMDLYESMDSDTVVGRLGFSTITVSGNTTAALGFVTEGHCGYLASTGKMYIVSEDNVELFGDNLKWNGTTVNVLVSDKRLKKDIDYHADGKLIALFDSLKPVTFKMTDKKYDNEQQHIGFIAQDVKESAEAAGLGDALVVTDCKGFYNLNYCELTAALVSKIKQLEQEIATIKGELS